MVNTLKVAPSHCKWKRVNGSFYLYIYLHLPTSPPCTGWSNPDSPKKPQSTPPGGTLEELLALACEQPGIHVRSLGRSKREHLRSWWESLTVDFQENLWFLHFLLIERNLGSKPRNYPSWRGLRSIIPNYFDVKSQRIFFGFWPAILNMSTSWIIGWNTRCRGRTWTHYIDIITYVPLS